MMVMGVMKVNNGDDDDNDDDDGDEHDGADTNSAAAAADNDITACNDYDADATAGNDDHNDTMTTIVLQLFT